MRCNPQGFILSTKCRGRWLLSPLTAYCPTLLKGVGLSVWLTGGLAPNPTFWPTNQIYTHFFCAKYVCIWLSKRGGCILNEFSLTSNEHTAIFYVMPHFSTPLRRVDFLMFGWDLQLVSSSQLCECYSWNPCFLSFCNIYYTTLLTSCQELF